MKTIQQKTTESRLDYLKRARNYIRRKFNELREESYKYHHVSFDVRDAMLAGEQRFSDLGTFGVESIIKSNDEFYNGPDLDYLNTGDSYETTILYNGETDQFIVGCWADFVEKYSTYNGE